MGSLVNPDEWVVAYEQPDSARTLPSLDPPTDAAGAGILFLETVLKDSGIECMFYPHRPTVGLQLGYGGAPPQLLVRQRDLEEARSLISEALESDLDPEDEWASGPFETGGFSQSAAPERTVCPNCGAPYDPGDYDPAAHPWLCPVCQEPIRR